ncbi:MAG: UDP-N-acetylmuramate--L-alanine ligase [Gammaproteobacteria bacterium]|nr:UDP-N-acetylmuramate--L-alanine ligase [Gammaproteobacteria bacterium]
MTFNIGHFATRKIKHVHFVGIGGSGMGGIAEVMVNLGYQVHGSDMQENAITQRLSKLGATIYTQHDISNIRDADVVVMSSAVGDDNPEIMAARKRRIPVVPRAEMLAELMRFRYGIAVAGTHGKTTTTSLIASVLAHADLDPTFIIGGRVNSFGSHSKLGGGQYLVAEADESDSSFLYLQPIMSVVTNIDSDHLSAYGGDFNALQDAFLQFIHHLPFYGIAVLCIDDETVSHLLPSISRPYTTYGFSTDADYRVAEVAKSGTQTTFVLSRPGKLSPVRFVLNLLGAHNVLNAVAAAIIALHLDVKESCIQSAFEHFQGIARRFQIYPEICINSKHVQLVDDYGHHPAEIIATMTTVRDAWPERRLIVLFQPHRYSRTRDLFDDFVRVLNEADVLMLCEVYAANEDPIAGADSLALSRALRARGKLDPILVKNYSEIQSTLEHVVNEGDVLLTLGAGSIGNFAQRLHETFVTH